MDREVNEFLKQMSAERSLQAS
ncbi:MAG: gas vesicle protein GvpC [Chloroflexi bacterium]|nr:gas vesicle protein GvpC [Ktedonobacteraceae bacterium]MBV8821209.1 gas vesicle protein GvpC [Ktedonobacteraceae bacterium]MBV9020275.1 gas vesicle protein GvpC [Ktedonobacteraceae bacterium]MBV9707993.1 gas vesicle protein GvpC [Chloroflexota bacterium]